MIELGGELLAGLAWGGVGIALLAVGYVVIDWLTPGNLGELVFNQRNANAAIVVSSGMLANATVITVAIVTSEDGLVDGLLSAAGWGLLGIFLLALSFWVVDWLTPGDLGHTVTSPAPHPAAWLTAASHLSVGAIVAAAIS